MTYNVFGGTLSFTQLINLILISVTAVLKVFGTDLHLAIHYDRTSTQCNSQYFTQ